MIHFEYCKKKKYSLITASAEVFLSEYVDIDLLVKLFPSKNFPLYSIFHLDITCKLDHRAIVNRALRFSSPGKHVINVNESLSGQLIQLNCSHQRATTTATKKPSRNDSGMYSVPYSHQIIQPVKYRRRCSSNIDLKYNFMFYYLIKNKLTIEKRV
jgi:hypothetical protein